MATNNTATRDSDLDEFLASVEQDAYRLALAACKNADEAVDIVQDAMLVLVKKYRNRSADQWAPLFHRILQNRIRDWFRRRSVKHTLLKWSGLGDQQDVVEQIAAPSNHNPEIQRSESDNIGRINMAISELPAQQQQVFLLRTWQELSVSETAKAMSISESSVKTHHARAIANLKNELESIYQTDG